MNHLEEGTLQAFLDDELKPRQRADVAEHLMGCRECRRVKEELVRARSVFSEAVSLLDVDAPGEAAPRRSLGAGGGAFVKAAGLTLLLAAAASAAVPGSPVREWLVRTVQPEPAQEAPVLEAVQPAPEPARASLPAGVSLPASSPVDVVIDRPDGTTIRLVETEGANVAVSALGTERDPAFSTAAGRIEVRGAVGGEITVAVPPTNAPFRLVVDGEVYAARATGALTVGVRAETVDGALVWR
jgi:anti-sigma factor RsiW